MTRTVTFIANDDTKLVFPVPKRTSPHLIIRAVDRVAKGDDAGIVSFGLTKAETELAASIVAQLEEHARREAVT